MFNVRFLPGRARLGYPVIGRLYGCLGGGFETALDPACLNRSTAMRPFLVRTRGLLLTAAGAGEAVVVLAVVVATERVGEVLIAGLELSNVGEGTLLVAGFGVPVFLTNVLPLDWNVTPSTTTSLVC